MNIRLDGVQSCHVHLQQTIFPVDPWDPAVVDAPRYVAELFPVFAEAVVLVVHAEGGGRSELTHILKTHLATLHHPWLSYCTVSSRRVGSVSLDAAPSLNHSIIIGVKKKSRSV